MSLDAIDYKLTNSTTDENGVTWWSNPVINVTISEEGKVKYKDSGKYVPINKSGTYTIKLNINNKWVGWCGSFNSLFSRMVLGVRLANHTLKLKDPTLGYIVSNVDVLPNIYKHNSSKQTIVKESTKVVEAVPTPTQQFYTLHEAKNEHITEDGAVFPTRELAEWHQTNVSKGKGNAQIVLDYNGGYILAEQIYLQEVVYNKAKPYANFIDVLNNNQGIISNVQEEHCVFDKIDGEGFKMLTNFNMSGVYNLTTSKFKAVKVQEALEQYSKSYTAFNESANHLDKLIKESV